MKVLFAASEAYPFIKSGGLGDVAYSLPRALRKIGVDVRVIIPKYSDISQNFKDKLKHIGNFNVPVGWRNSYCGIEYYEYQDVPFYFIDNEYYFKRHGSYGFYDDGERFSYFCRAVIESIKYMEGFVPDVIHCNDWHTGMIPLLLNEHYKSKGEFTDIRTLFTIHNLKYQGVFSKDILNELLCLGNEYYDEDKIKYFDGVSFMKAGINYSDIITTVSKTYAEEIRQPFFGEGLHGLLNSKSNILHGIVNGIDYDIFNPETDNEIWKKYGKKTIKHKVKNKLELQKMLNLPVNENIPIIGIVSRLVKQKGFDLVACVIQELLSMDIQVVVLGTGDDDYQDLFEYYAYTYPSRLSSNIRFNDSLAKKIYAGSDMFLMPSLFEPCGIGQIIALRYGTVPIVRETGGLKDTVISYNEFTNEGTGFTFANYDANEMINTIKYALKYYNDKTKWGDIMLNGMKQNNSWEASAKVYENLYNSLND